MTPNLHRARHEHLLGRMAEVFGINLDLELDLTRLPRADLPGALTRRTQCPDPSGCAPRRDEHRADADTTPHLCRNKKMLEYLRMGCRGPVAGPGDVLRSRSPRPLRDRPPR